MYTVETSECGDVLGEFGTLEEALVYVNENVEEDKANGTYTEGYYQVWNRDNDELVAIV